MIAPVFESFAWPAFLNDAALQLMRYQGNARRPNQSAPNHARLFDGTGLGIYSCEPCSTSRTAASTDEERGWIRVVSDSIDMTCRALSYSRWFDGENLSSPKLLGKETRWKDPKCYAANR